MYFFRIRFTRAHVHTTHTSVCLLHIQRCILLALTCVALLAWLGGFRIQYIRLVDWSWEVEVELKNPVGALLCQANTKIFLMWAESRPFSEKNVKEYVLAPLFIFRNFHVIYIYTSWPRQMVPSRKKKHKKVPPSSKQEKSSIETALPT